MIPAALFAILSVSRLGAIHTVVFGGFSGAALAQRIDDASPKLIMTASCSIEGRKGILAYRPLIEKALEMSHDRPEKILVWQREQKPWLPLSADKGELDWNELVHSGNRRNIKAEAVPIHSDEPVYILYTSGKE
jgi:propionyl-CoA synthetase